MVLLVLLACSTPSLLVRIPGATRVTELANGELLVGTSTGQLWLVTSFGEATRLPDLSLGPVAGLVADPLGRFWVRTDEGEVYSGGIWSPPTRVAEGAAVLVRRCEDTRWMTAAEAGPGVTALSLSSSCEALVAGTSDGRVDGHEVTTAPIVRVQSLERGVLWVDANGNAGCVGCEAQVPTSGVVDALSLHLAPFVAREIVWIDGEGRLWIAPA